MKGEERDVRKAAEAIGGQVSPEAMQAVQSVLENIFKTGTVPKEALGFTNEKMDAIYGQAYRLYNTGNYQEAVSLFRILVLLDSTEPKYTLGIAACFHMMKEYQNAVQAYTIAAVLDPNSPVPHFHASDCYIQMRDKASAIIALEMAVQRAGSKPEYEVLKGRALLSIDSLKKELQSKV